MGAAPSAILKLNDALKAHAKRPKSYRFSGIVGDANHGYGYHLSPNDISGWDYSLQTARDKAGASKYPNYASAWDLSFSTADMKVVTRRLLNAAKAHDPRLHAVREFCGTLNGLDTYPWDLHNNGCEGIGSWDDSHLWHVHISFYRDVCNNYDAMKGVVDVICGVPLPKPAPTPAPRPATPPKYPLSVAKLQSFGVNRYNGKHSSGPVKNWIKMIQLELIRQGYAGKVDKSWADGIFEAPTAVAVKKLQRQMGIAQTGNVGMRVWNRLFGVK